MRIIPAIDILGGKCVRLTRGNFSEVKIYNNDPLEVAKEYEDNGIRYLHMVDLDGARKKMIINYRVLERLSSKTNLQIDFGGGLRSDHDLTIAFHSGAKQVTIGSIAISDQQKFMKWLQRYGNEKIILGSDCSDKKIAYSGWMEKSEENVIDFIKRFAGAGVKYTICTDVDRDGMLIGPSTELYREILDTTDVSLTASGGITTLKDIEDVREAGCDGVIIGKAIYEGRIKLKELSDLC